MRELVRGPDRILPIVDKPGSKFYVLVYKSSFCLSHRSYYPVGKRKDGQYCLYGTNGKIDLSGPIDVDSRSNFHVDRTIQEVLQQVSSYLGNGSYHLYEFESLKEFLDSEV